MGRSANPGRFNSQDHYDGRSSEGGLAIRYIDPCVTLYLILISEERDNVLVAQPSASPMGGVDTA
jgi:hypothetical protein